MSQQFVTEISFDRIIEIIEQNKHKYRFIRSTYADSINGRCTLGLIASHFGWGGKDTTPGINTIKEYTDLTSPKMRSFIARLNDTCWSYEEVIDKLRTCDYPTEIEEMSKQIVTEKIDCFSQPSKTNPDNFQEALHGLVVPAYVIYRFPANRSR